MTTLSSSNQNRGQRGTFEITTFSESRDGVTTGGVPDFVGPYPTGVALVESAKIKDGNEVARFRVVFSDTY